VRKARFIRWRSRLANGIERREPGTVDGHSIEWIYRGRLRLSNDALFVPLLADSPAFLYVFAPAFFVPLCDSALPAAPKRTRSRIKRRWKHFTGPSKKGQNTVNIEGV